MSAAVPLPPLLLLTDRLQLRLGRGLVRTVGECVEAGLTHVVLRELDLPRERRAALAAELATTGAVVIAAHEPLPGATGVHLQSRTAPRASNAVSAEVAACWNTLLPASTPCYSLRGRSCHSRVEVTAAAAAGSDYVTLSPFAATASKPGYGPPLPPVAYAGHALPVFALGGIDPGNAELALEAGAHGVAVMGAVMRAASPKSVVRELLAVVG
jgi:thiamine-phosphate pyrophosphorylase